MMNKTHLTIGVGSALLLTHPQSMQEFGLALIGGTVGGLLPDCDILDNGGAVKGSQMFAVGVTVAVLVVDYVMHFGIWNELLLMERTHMMYAAIAFVCLYLIGVLTAHRGFTHSILGGISYSVPLYWICPKLIPFFAVGYASHIFIDLFNKRGEKIFYPWKKGICFKVCYADRWMNKIFMRVGMVMIVVAFVRDIVQM